MLPKVTIPKLLEPPLRQVREKRRDPSRQRAAPVELQLLQRNIRRMEAASPKIILERLKEEWVEVADASVYRELELEKQLWMLSALRGLKKKSATIPELETVVPSSGITKILSLYENQGASFIYLPKLLLTFISLLLHPLSPHNSKRSPPPFPNPPIAEILPQYSTSRRPRTNLPATLCFQHLHINPSLLSPRPPPSSLTSPHPQRMPPHTHLRPLARITH